MNIILFHEMLPNNINNLENMEQITAYVINFYIHFHT